jgi:hypothetical protein
VKIIIIAAQKTVWNILLCLSVEFQSAAGCWNMYYGLMLFTSRVHGWCVPLGTAHPHYTHPHLPSTSDSETKIMLCSHYMWIPDLSTLEPGNFSLTCKYQNKIATVTTVQVSDMKHLHSPPATSLFISGRKLYLLNQHNRYTRHRC